MSGDLAGLVERARTLMLANLDRPEQSTTGSPRRGEDHWVAGRKGTPVPALRHDDPARRPGPGPAGTGDLVVPAVPGGARH